MEQNTMEHHNVHPIFGILLMLATAFGFAGLQDIDIILAIILKSVSILSFIASMAYLGWKWRKEYKAHKNHKK